MPNDQPAIGHARIEAAEMPVIRRLVRLLIVRFENRVTLLAVCPNSEAVARAALPAAREANAPLLLAATLNQVDSDGGYTGWTPGGLVDFVQREAARIGLEAPVLPCLDHGWPWLKDRHTKEGLSLLETMQAVKESLEACIDAGYALLHIDPTVDRTLPDGEPIPIQWVVDRTLELIEHAEGYRIAQGRPPIGYEVGKEEVHGGLADMQNFDAFLHRLDEGLTARELTHAWPAFVVGKVGTDLHTSYFEPSVAHVLTPRVRPFGALIKGHYTDRVDNPEDYPLSGMGAANVGPEFTEEEYLALVDLIALERKLGMDSGLEEALRDAVVSSNRWKKWLQPEEPGVEFSDLREDRREWLVRTGCRYIWAEPNVLEAREVLYDNLADYRDADAFVVWRIKQSILKYYHAFNLIDFQEKVGSQSRALGS